MSCFKGTFTSLPGVACDNFDQGNWTCDQFFLSHCHSDHMRGIENLCRNLRQRNGLRVNHRIYCSMISKAFLVRKYPFLDEKFVKDLFLDEPVEINVFDKVTKDLYKIRVTAISANHCPGSIMFLFDKLNENKEVCQRILYTGDFRFEDLNDMTELKSLHIDRQPISIDEMYLDTTFCSVRFPEFPSRQKSIDRIWELVSSWVRKNGMYRNQKAKHVVLFQLPAQYGSEAILKAIYERSQLKWKIHVNHKKEQDYLCADELCDCTSSDSRIAVWVHACSWKDQADKMSKSEFNHPLPCQNGQFEVRTIRPCAMHFNREVLEDCQDGVSSPVNEKFIRVCYSCHPSLNELLTFVKHFGPKKLIPCVVPKDMTMSQVTKAFESILRPENIDFDDTQDIVNNLNSYPDNVSSSSSASHSSDPLRSLHSPSAKGSKRRNQTMDNEHEFPGIVKRSLRFNEMSSADPSRKKVLVTEESSDEDTFSPHGAISKRKEFMRSKSKKTNYSMPAVSTLGSPTQQNRRASLPHNLKIPQITITPSSPSPDPNHPDYPEFFEFPLYLKTKQMSTSTESGGGKVKMDTTSDLLSEEAKKSSDSLDLKLSPERKDLEMNCEHLSNLSNNTNEIINISADEDEPLESTPELDVVMEQVQGKAELLNCKKFASIQ